MADITITIPDQLINYYNQARTSWNAYAPTVGQLPLPAPTKLILQNRAKTQMKQWIIGEALRTGMEETQLDALIAILDGL